MFDYAEQTREKEREVYQDRTINDSDSAFEAVNTAKARWFEITFKHK